MPEEFGERPPCLTVRSPRDVEATRAVRAQLDAGEAEAIALAVEHPGSAVLLDEQRGRAYALALGVPVVGTFGLLTRTKRQGAVPAVRPLLDALVDALVDAGFYASGALYRRALALADETGT